MTIGVLAFVVALLLSIMLHEAGHFVFARAFGMKATQFFLGFGPTLWSFRRGETEYGVKAIPAGGFVKIVGMTSLEEVAPADEKRAFYRQPAPQRAVVLAAGSVVHFVIGFLLLLAVFSAIGTPVTTTTIAEVSPCVPATVNDRCNPGDPASPAAAAGLRAGDRILAIDGRPVQDWTSFSRDVRAHGAGPVSLGVERDGRRQTLTPVVVTASRPSLDDPTRTQTVGVLGIAPGQQRQRLSLPAGLGRSGALFGDSLTGTFTALGKIPAAVPKLLSLDSKRTADSSPASVVGVARLSGEAIGAEADLASRISFFLLIIASLNIFVGIFNLLPLLPLDGGHLAVLGFEQARAGLYRLLRRPAPNRVDLTKLLPAAYLVIALFVGLSVLLLLADIINPISNPFTG